jgi:hypothetical protein
VIMIVSLSPCLLVSLFPYLPLTLLRFCRSRGVEAVGVDELLACWLIAPACVWCVLLSSERLRKFAKRIQRLMGGPALCSVAGGGNGGRSSILRQA